MDIFTLQNMSFTYAGKSSPALQDITLHVQEGEFLLLCGASGSGKTTLLRQLKPALSPAGDLSGSILFRGEPLSAVSFRRQSAEIGYVMQDPENQIVAETVEQELSFGMENLGWNADTIRLRMAEMVDFFGLQNELHMETAQLSGGKKQLLNLASVMAMQPEVLLLDEPTSMLDPIAASSFLEAAYRLNREMGITVILSEHHLEQAFSMADRVAVLHEGKLIFCDSPRKAGAMLHTDNLSARRLLPVSVQMYSMLSGEKENAPLNVREGRTWLRQYMQKLPQPAEQNNMEVPSQKVPALEAKNLWFRYERNSKDILRGLNFALQPGEIYGLLGGNGSGKSTLLSLLAGVYSPYRGKVVYSGEKKSKRTERQKNAALLPQDPRHLFLHETLQEDLHSLAEIRQKETVSVEEVISEMQLGSFLQSHPYDLSGGERQKAALAMLLLLNPQVYLLDEPTKGLDPFSKEQLGELLRKLTKSGASVLLVSHDVEFCARYADRCGLLFDGELVSQGIPKIFFSENKFYTTAVSRITGDLLPGAVTLKDVIQAWPSVATLEKE